MSQMLLETQYVESADDVKWCDEEDLIARFLKHVSESPEAVALLTTHQTWTYQALYQEVLQWKQVLSQYVEDSAIVFLERTPRLIAILLALQWLRVTYIPVDVNTPIQRLLSIVEDSEAQTLLYDMPLSTQDFPCVVLNVGEVNHHRHTSFSDAVCSTPLPRALAYIIYTSGSTGKPKGVAISYRALNHFLYCMSRVFLHESHAMLLAVTTIAFDIAQLELWLPFWQKRTLFLANQAQHRAPLLLTSILAKYPITLLQSTPSFWSMLFTVGWSGKAGLVALCGGEALSEVLASQLLASVDTVWNMYGPTEATVWCAMKQLQKNEPITVGRPIANMSFFVLDESGARLPSNVKGELYIAGLGLAEGYVNREILNRERFIVRDDVRLYRVGDFAIRTVEGEFIILGRTDNQIKLHGYRIELEEIEALIKQYPAVINGAVIVHQEQLIAYVSVHPESYLELPLIDYLKQHLPPYMIPSRFIVLSALPLSLNGKIDRHALPMPFMPPATVVVNCTMLEEQLCAIWREALHCHVTPVDNFFALGGHSLIAARIVLQVAHQLGKSLTLDALYRAPTVRALANLVEDAPFHIILPRVQQIIPRTWFPLTDYQFMFWLSQRFESGLKVFNVVARRRFEEKLDRDILDKALAFVFQKHGVLFYRVHSFYPAQRFAFEAPIRWEEQSLSLMTSSASDVFLMRSYDALFYRHQWSFDKPRVLAKLFYLPGESTELQICLSHLIADERSLDIFFQDLLMAYQCYMKHGRAPVQKIAQPFGEHALEVQQCMQSKQQEATAFWKTYLADTSYFPMPEQYIIPKMTLSAEHYVTYIDFPEMLLQKVQVFCAQHQLTLNDVCIAAVGLALQDCTSQVFPHPILINTVKSTRGKANMDDMIGCFLEMMVIKLQLSATRSLLDVAKEAQQSWLETLRYQEVASLIKYAAVGQCQLGMGHFKRYMIRGALAFYARLIKRHVNDTRLFKACAEVAVQERKKHFFVSINLLNSFMSSTPHVSDLREVDLLSHPFPVMPLTSVLDVWFYGEHGAFQPKLLIASNLETTFRERLAEAVIHVIQEAVGVLLPTRS